MKPLQLLGVSLALAALSFVAANVQAKSEVATRDDAVAMVKKGVAFIKAGGSVKCLLLTMDSFGG